MKNLFKHSALLLLFFTLLGACDESDRFSTDPSLQLAYSQEELYFDTVFRTIASPYQKLKIYNNNNSSITFRSIKLVNGEKSEFRINVDGLSGTEFTDVDLLRKDSLLIVVDAKLSAPNGADANVKDYIELSWNGNVKRIPLEAYGIDVDIWDDKTIEGDTYIRSDKSYYIRGKVTIGERAIVAIQEGTNFYFDKEGSLVINGTLIAKGTADKRIAFRGHRFDWIQQNVPYSNVSGQWQGITIGANSFDNIFENVNIRGAKSGLTFVKSTCEKKKATLINTIVHSTEGDAVMATNCKVEGVNCQFSNSGGSLLRLTGGDYGFLHCTIANYYQWGDRFSSSVVLSELEDETPLKCLFANSIITGTFFDEVDLFVEENNQSVQFVNCLIQSSEAIDDRRFVNTIWNIDSVFLFKELNSVGDFYYSFELPKESVAINTANLDYTQMVPADLRGISRMENGKPDIGCYEWFDTGEDG